MLTLSNNEWEYVHIYIDIHVPEYRKIKLSEHIDVCGHGQFPFYKLLSDNVIEWREKEKYFIQLLKPSIKSLS